MICDRYTPSTVVYQSLVKGFSFDDLNQLNKILKIPEADLTFIFKVSEADQTRRLHQFRTELDMYEDDPEFRKQVISAFNELADKNNYEVVDSSLDRDVITEQIVERILLERNK